MYLRDILKKEKGISVIALIMAILLLGSIGYIMSSLMSGQQETVARSLDSTRAFQIAQGGIEYTGKYLKGVTDWTTLSGSINRNLGLGNFVVAFSGPTATDVTATITGNNGSAHRQITVGFHKTSSGGIRSRGGIQMLNNSWIDCEPANPFNTNCSSPGSCPCVSQNVPAANMPTIAVPGGLSPPSIGCSYGNNFTGNILAGTYRCASGMTFNSNVVISITGTVTIFTTTLTLNNNATFNSGGSAAKLLVIASGNVNFGNNSVFTGAVYAPGRTITLNNNGSFNGTLAGGTSTNPNSISLSNNASVNYYPGAGSASTYYSQTGGGGTSIVTATSWQE